ncbi:MAG: hypothetical protein WAX77_06440 [Methylococcaceae bacterium]
MQNINWDNFGLKGESKQKSFEALCKALFCRELGVKEDEVNSYDN